MADYKIVINVSLYLIFFIFFFNLTAEKKKVFYTTVGKAFNLLKILNFIRTLSLLSIKLI